MFTANLIRSIGIGVLWIIGGIYCLVVDIDPIEFQLVQTIIHILWYALTVMIIWYWAFEFWDNADQIAVRINGWIKRDWDL